jgi:hypothetical protein
VNFFEAAQSIVDFEQEGLEIVSLFCDDANQVQEQLGRSTCSCLLLVPCFS